MKRLLSLKLENFQCHGSLSVSFSPTITTIKGPSDVGKSAILRALGWVCRNNITGEEFIKEGKEETRVILTVAVGEGEVKITRRRGRENAYELEGEEYKSFGFDVPDPIKKVLSLGDINFQGQHDAPFWFTESAPEVSRRMNAVIDLGIIDTTLANIANEVRRVQERRTLTEERLTEAKDKLKELEPGRERVEEFKLLKDRHDQHFDLETKCISLSGKIQKIQSLREVSRVAEEKAAGGKELVAGMREVLDQDSRIADLEEYIGDIKRFEAESVPPPDFDVVESCFDQWRDLDAHADTLTRFIRSLVDATAEADTWKEKLRLADKRYHEQTDGRACPLCGKTI
jgi:chromosome segregation ATPase